MVVAQRNEVPLFIGYERFLITNRTPKRSNPAGTALIVGQIRNTIVQQNAIRPGIIALSTAQNASDAKALSLESLRTYGVYTRGQQHANDGARHMLLQILKYNPALAVRLPDMVGSVRRVSLSDAVRI
jgi:hypothetical protein